MWITFDQQADDDVLRRTAPRKLTGLDLAEARLSTGDSATAASMARQALAAAASDPAVDTGRANFILARTAIMGGDPDSAIAGFQKAADTAKETRVRAWSHIYLGRMMDLACKRDDAIAQYNQALAVRDGQQDTRLAAERGLKTAYAAKQGHTCQADDSDSDSGSPAKDDPEPGSGNAKTPTPANPATSSSGSAAPK
jgi:tetratricopeptide (TPR) repeat protein